MIYRIVNMDEYPCRKDALQKHFDKVHFDRIMKHKQSFCGYNLAVDMLEKIIGDDFHISFEKSGRPYIVGNKIYFSISHSNNYVACVIDKYCCGIDIESKREISQRLINKMMSESEQKWIYGNIEGYDKDTAFLILWTMKEAYLKTQSFNTVLDAKKLDFVSGGALISDRENMKCKTVIDDDLILSMWYYE